MAHRIVLLGAPGAGKGTQAKRLKRKHGWPHISTGDIFRAHVENKTVLGIKIENYMRSGQLLPDTLACEIVAERLKESDCSDGFILDGFPRTMPQAEALDKLLNGRGEALNIVISIDVMDDELVERITARRTCPVCGKIYNLKSKPPKSDGKCDVSTCNGAGLLQRDDDKEDTIRERLRLYHEKTEPIIAFYRKKGILKPVGGAYQTPDDMTTKIEEIISAVNESRV